METLTVVKARSEKRTIRQFRLLDVDQNVQSVFEGIGLLKELTNLRRSRLCQKRYVTFISQNCSEQIALQPGGLICVD
jgi:hypothetical protein